MFYRKKIKAFKRRVRWMISDRQRTISRLNVVIKRMELDIALDVECAREAALNSDKKIKNTKALIGELNIKIQGLADERDYERKERQSLTKELISVTTERDLANKSLKDSIVIQKQLSEELDIKNNIIKFELRRGT